MDKIPFFDRIAALKSRAASIIFTKKCVICHSALWYDEKTVCADCLAAWSASQRAKCPVCSKTAQSCTCRPISMTSTGKVGERYISALAFYGKPDSEDKRDIAVRRLINSLKKSPDRSSVKFLAADLSRIILKKLLTGGEKPEDWAVCCPPRTRERIREYGFDQSRELTRSISRMTGIKFENCFKNSGSTLQKTLNIIERKKNAEESYRLTKNVHAEKGKYIIIDDIITTGATVSTCAGLLYGAGAEVVFPVCVARTKPKKRKVRRKAAHKLWFR